MNKKLKIYKTVMEQSHSMHSSHGIQHKINELAIDGWSFVSLSLTQEGHLSTIAVAVLGQCSGRGGEVTIYAGYLPISMPAQSLRDGRVYGGLTFQGKDIVGIETYAHARDYAEGEQVGIVVRSEE